CRAHLSHLAQSRLAQGHELSPPRTPGLKRPSGLSLLGSWDYRRAPPLLRSFGHREECWRSSFMFHHISGSQLAGIC
uniref:Uncharacterized protein n=1 Tax=Strigops habroptila TaxID=2489341 RepID=A0A672U9X5_STRHB